MIEVVREVRHTVRSLMKRPMYVLVVVGTLALGFGANTAIYSLVRGVLLSPLPYEDAESLVMLRNQFPESDDGDLAVSREEMKDWRAEEGLFTGVAAIRTGEQNALWTLEMDGRTEKHDGAWVTSDFFDVLGVEAELGRTFLPEESIDGRHRVMVLSDAFWRGRFGADPSIVGQTLRIRGVELEVVGVVPAGFNTAWNVSGARAVDFWVVDPVPVEDQPRQWWGYNAVARLAPGVSLAQARARADRMADGFVERFADVYRSSEEYTVSLQPLEGQITSDVRTPLMVLFVTVGAVLLIACINVANLLLVRAEDAQPEIALRSALGASPGEMARPFVVETGVLASIGAVSGVGVALGAIALVKRFNPGGIPRIGEVGLDLGVLAFTGAIALGTVLLVSLAPGLRAARVDAGAILKDGARSMSGGLFSSRLRGTLVVGEVAMALVLTVGAGLLLQSFKNLTDIGIGIESEGVLSMRMDFPVWQYGDMEEVSQVHEGILASAGNVTGVRSVALAHADHPLRLNGQWYFAPEGSEADPEATKSMVGIRVASPGYLETLRIPLLSGRSFDERDRAGEPFTILVNETLAKKRFPNEDPIGRRLKIVNAGRDMPPFEIIGVIGDVKNEGIRETVRETLILPRANPAFAAGWTRHLTLHVRTLGRPSAVAGAVRAAIAEVDPKLTVYDIKALDEVVSETVATPRFITTLVGFFAALALLLSALGIYGVTSYSVSRRTQEIGVRIALGARAAQVERLVVGQGVKLGLVGLALGIGGAAFGMRALTSILYGITPGHLPTFAVVATILFAVVTAASYLPARRASRIQPVQALRDD
ncbi:MAG: ABC transporter permease [Gemmatimonadota bacterium]|nr:MAG: ABC transporter permease [Gemmatimonadota bacterium]